MKIYYDSSGKRVTQRIIDQLFAEWLKRQTEVDQLNSDAIQQKTISKPPGALLSAVTDFLCSRKTCSMIVEPLIADMQFEYFEALSKHRKSKAIWIHIRESMRLLYILGVHRILQAVANLVSQTKTPR